MCAKYLKLNLDYYFLRTILALVYPISVIKKMEICWVPAIADLKQLYL